MPATAFALWSRLGNEKTAQFPSIVRALEKLRPDAAAHRCSSTPRSSRSTRRAIRPDFSGCRDASISPARARSNRSTRRSRSRIIAFDLLRDGDDDLRGLPLTERRAGSRRTSSRTSRARSASANRWPTMDGRCTRGRCGEGWEGLIVKEARAPYQSGRRSPAWRKLKVVHEQEFVVGGWTEPRHTRSVLRRAAARRARREDRCVDLRRTHGNRLRSGRARTRVEAAEGARDSAIAVFRRSRRRTSRRTGCGPELVAQVRFTEWTADAKLRHPVYLGLRDDKRRAGRSPRRPWVRPESDCASDQRSDRVRPRATSPPRSTNAGCDRRRRRRTTARPRGRASRRHASSFPAARRLGVTNLAKVFWPRRQADQRRSAPLLRGGLAAHPCPPSPIARSS